MKQKKIPLRKCIVCQEMLPKKEMLRVVRTPEEQILLDLTGKKSGRGTYVCRRETCMTPNTFATNRWKKVLERALNTTITDEQYAAFQQNWLEMIGK